jgi:hypothetical protein
MMKALIPLITLLTTLAANLIPAFADDVWVDGYTRSNGTQVQGYYRTRPDGNPYNNYSSQGNTNPYTGQKGSVSSYSNNNYDSNVGLPTTNLQSPYNARYGH